MGEWKAIGAFDTSVVRSCVGVLRCQRRGVSNVLSATSEPRGWCVRRACSAVLWLSALRSTRCVLSGSPSLSLAVLGRFGARRRVLIRSWRSHPRICSGPRCVREVGASASLVDSQPYLLTAADSQEGPSVAGDAAVRAPTSVTTATIPPPLQSSSTRATRTC